MEAFALLGFVLLFATLGAMAGMGTGLVPGVHVNNVALALLAAEPAIAGALADRVGGADAIALLTAFLVAAAVAHGFAGLLPSVFLGVPDAKTALSVLPGHRLLQRGRGAEAVVLAARGALLAVPLSLLLLLPFRLLLGSPVDAYARLRTLVPFLLLLLVVLLVATEGGRAHRRQAVRSRAWAVVLFVLAGVLGGVVLRPGFLSDTWRPLPLPTESLVLFPLFTGLFGLPTLILGARRTARLPPQDLGPPDPLPDWRQTRALASGTLAGASVSWFPGLGGASATVVAQLLARGEPAGDDVDGDREFLFAAGAASTATTVFTFATLFVVLRARSGVAAAIATLADPVPVWVRIPFPPPLFAALLLAVVLAAAIAYMTTVRLARPFAILAGRVPYPRIVRSVLLALVAAVFLVVGPVGLLVLGTATALGLLPPLVGVRRVHLMGCLVLPLLVGSL